MAALKWFKGRPLCTLSVVMLASISLHGCVFAPGQHLNPRQLASAGSAVDGQVEQVPITPQWLALNAAKQGRDAVPAPLLAFVPGAYRIGANDLLFITVWDHPELTAPSGQQQQLDANGRLVRPDGTLFYPYIGNIPAAGKTIEALRTLIAERLSQFVESPQVDVNVLRFASQTVLVSGAVLRAGLQPITTTPLSAVQAIGMAGVDPAHADLSGLTLTREGHEYTLDLDALNRKDSQLQDVYLKDGDRLYLPYNDLKKIYVLGEVNQPRAVSFNGRSISLADALGTVGGLNQATADGNAVYVIRGAQSSASEPAKVFQLDAESPAAYALASRFDVQPQDIVYVGASGVTRWNRLISQLVPSASVMGSGTQSLNDLSEVSHR